MASMDSYKGQHARALRRSSRAVSWQPKIESLSINRAIIAISRFHVHGERMTIQESELLIDEIIIYAKERDPDFDIYSEESLTGWAIKELKQATCTED